MTSFNQMGHFGCWSPPIAHTGWAGGTCVLSSHLHCLSQTLSACLMYLWDLDALCCVLAPLGPQKLLLTLAVPSQTSSKPLPHPLARHNVTISPPPWVVSSLHFLFPSSEAEVIAHWCHAPNSIEGEKPLSCKAQAIFRGTTDPRGGTKHQKACWIGLVVC